MAGSPAADITGQTFSRLTVLSRDGRTKWGAAVWLCLCECGTKTSVAGDRLRSGRVKSCGCLHAGRIRGWGRQLGLRRKTHGSSGTKEYRAYHGAKTRCTNPNTNGYPKYGGRGIEFRFSSFEEWLGELGPAPSPAHSVDRIDVNGHYEPGNVRWATSVVQNNNRHHCATCTCV